MSVATNGAERAMAARQWFDQAAESSELLSWEDVELVAQLGITEAGAARNLLLAAPEALFSSWADLQAYVAGGGDSDDGTRLVSVEDRLRALSDWHDRTQAEGRDHELASLGAEDLSRIANSDATTAADLRKLVALSARRVVWAHADEIAAVLTGSSAGAVPDQGAVIALPGRQAQPAPTPDLQRATAPAKNLDLDLDESETSWTDFASFDYACVIEGQPAPQGISFVTSEDERIEMTWPEVDTSSDVVLYRVKTSDEYAPIASTDLGDLIAVTKKSGAVDVRGFGAPVRHVAVWANRGRTEAEARRAQPLLVAAGGCVLPVRRCEVREDEGTVVGQWEPLTGVVRIDVLRVNARVANQTSLYDPDFRLRPDQVGAGGFTDREANPGEELEYRIYVVARVAGDSEEMSQPVVHRVRVRAVVHPVDDLRVTQSVENDSSYDLCWTLPPNGHVEIYRSQLRPAAGLGQETLTREAIVRAQLTAADKLLNQEDRLDGEGLMRHVTWPSGWAKAYFTPVTVLDEKQIRVGKTKILTRSQAVSDVRLVERVDSQYLTFAWPSGVMSVKIFTGPAHVELVSPETERPVAELSEEEYRKYGGAHLPHPLPVDGCAVHLVGASYSQGRAELAKPVSIQYAGLARVRYWIETPATERDGRFGRKGPKLPPRLMASCDAPVKELPLALVHNVSRLPLFLMDGIELTRAVASFQVGVPTEILRDVSSRPTTGFVRLFADVPPDAERRLAVLDPSIDQLRCG